MNVITTALWLTVLMVLTACTPGFEQANIVNSSSTRAVIPAVNRAPPELPKTKAAYTRRLLRTEIMLSLSDIFGADVLANNDVESNFLQVDFDPSSNLVLSYDSDINLSFVIALKKIAEKIGDIVSTDATKRSAIVGTCAATQIQQACLDSFIATFGRKVLRRPLSPTEVTSYKALAAQATSFVKIKAVITRMILSPDFLFQLEIGDERSCATPPCATPRPDGYFALTPFELASRLSFQITGSTPDEVLLTAAANNNLSNETQAKTQADRLLTTAKSKNQFQRFIRDWMNVAANTDPVDFVAADFGVTNTNLSEATLKELKLYTDHIVWDKNSNLVDLLSSNLSFPHNEDVRKILGVPTVTSAATVSNRSGLLLRPAVLLSAQKESSPILRGVFVVQNLMCVPMQRPDPEKLAMAEAETEGVLDHLVQSNREYVTIQTSMPFCASCHNKINPIGFLLEAYGPLGELRTTEKVFDDTGAIVKTHPINTNITGAKIGYGLASTFNSPEELTLALANSDAVKDCFAKKYFEFTRMRTVTKSDEAILTTLKTSVRANSLLNSLSNGVVQNDLFYGKEQKR